MAKILSLSHLKNSEYLSQIKLDDDMYNSIQKNNFELKIRVRNYRNPTVDCKVGNRWKSLRRIIMNVDTTEKRGVYFINSNMDYTRSNLQLKYYQNKKPGKYKRKQKTILMDDVKSKSITPKNEMLISTIPDKDVATVTSYVTKTNSLDDLKKFIKTSNKTTLNILLTSITQRKNEIIEEDRKYKMVRSTITKLLADGISKDMINSVLTKM